MSQLQLFGQVLIASLLGGVIGLEREFQRKKAGLRTFSLVSSGSCFFTVIAAYLSEKSSLMSPIQIDPTRVIQAVAIGIGFIGSGLIVSYKLQVEGLTTAAALWLDAAIGIGVGLGLYWLSLLATGLAVLMLSVIKLLEKKIAHKEEAVEDNG